MSTSTCDVWFSSITGEGDSAQSFVPALALAHSFRWKLMLWRDKCSVCGDQIHSVWVAFLCMVRGQWCHHSCSGIHSLADYYLLAAGPMELSHMLHHSPTCSAHQGAGVLRLGMNMFDPLVLRLPLLMANLHQTQQPPSPDEHCCSRTFLRERQIPAVQLQLHPPLPCRTAGLPASPPGAGRLRATDHRPTRGGGLVTLVHHSIPNRQGWKKPRVKKKKKTSCFLWLESKVMMTSLGCITPCVPMSDHLC